MLSLYSEIIKFNFKLEISELHGHRLHIVCYLHYNAFLVYCILISCSFIQMCEK